MRLPTMTDVLAAKELLSRYLPPTPLWSYPTLETGSAMAVLLKHENTQPTGAFKVRGGLNLVAGLDADDRARGILGYSTGNHAQSLAYAAREFGVPCTIVMPKNPNPAKAKAVRSLGAELVEHGVDFEEAKGFAESLAGERGMRLVSSGDEPALVIGVATAYLEILERAPSIDTLVVPVGSGSGAAAACLVASAVAPQCRVIAVQSSASPAAHDAWRTGERVERPNQTIAEGLATGASFDLPQRILRERLDDFLLVDDDALVAAQRTLLLDAHTLVETAGAAAFAALTTHPETFAGRRVALMCSGGNIGAADLLRLGRQPNSTLSPDGS